MTYFEKLKDDKGRVEHLLKNYPLTRESDSMLIATFYFHESGDEVIKSQSAYDFLNDLATGKYTPASSIIRNRRKLQEQNKELRGFNYEERIKSGEDTRENIKNL
jgi:hypothetical protein